MSPVHAVTVTVEARWRPPWGDTARVAHSPSITLDRRRSQMSARRAPLAASRAGPESRAPISLRGVRNPSRRGHFAAADLLFQRRGLP